MKVSKIAKLKMEITTMIKPSDLVKDLLSDGYDLQQVSDFLSDGEALAKGGFTDQDFIEQTYSLVQKMMKEKEQYRVDTATDAVYELSGNHYVYIGHLHNRTLEQFIEDYEVEQDMSLAQGELVQCRQCGQYEMGLTEIGDDGICTKCLVIDNYHH